MRRSSHTIYLWAEPAAAAIAAVLWAGGLRRLGDTLFALGTQLVLVAFQARNCVGTLLARTQLLQVPFARF